STGAGQDHPYREPTHADSNDVSALPEGCLSRGHMERCRSRGKPHAYRRSLGLHVGDGGIAQYFHVIGPEDEWAGAVDFYRAPFGLVNLEHPGGDRPAIVRRWTESAPVHERLMCRAIPSPPPLTE